MALWAPVWDSSPLWLGPLNDSLRCDGKSDDCVPCWGMIQLVIGGRGEQEQKKSFGLCISDCCLFYYWTRWTVLSRFQIPPQSAVQSYNKQQAWAGSGTDRAVLTCVSNPRFPQSKLYTDNFASFQQQKSLFVFSFQSLFVLFCKVTQSFRC